MDVFRYNWRCYQFSSGIIPFWSNSITIIDKSRVKTYIFCKEITLQNTRGYSKHTVVHVLANPKSIVEIWNPQVRIRSGAHTRESGIHQ